MKQKLFLALSLFFLYNGLIAQTNYKPGYIINADGDTLKGLINYRKWDATPISAEFKTNETSEVQEFSASQIKEFGTENEIYEGATVQIEVSPTATNQITDESKFDLRTETVFLRVLISGEKSLYMHKSYTEKRNFYIKDKGEFQLLQYKRYKREVDGRTVIAENKNYLGQLSLYFAGWWCLNELLPSVNYEIKSLTNFFKEYYGNTKEKNYEFVEKKRHSKIAVVCGAYFNTLNFDYDKMYDDFSYFASAEYAASLKPAFGISFNYALGSSLGKWAFYGDIIYTSNEFKGDYKEGVNALDYSSYQNTIAFTYLRLDGMLRYNYFIGNKSAFVGLGLGYGSQLLNNSMSYRTRVLYGSTTVSARSIDGFGYELSQLVGVGLNLGKFSLELRGEHSKGPTVAVREYSSSYRAYLLAGYTF